jgi:uncharacterized phage protein (TIGR01671 family)
MREIKFRAYIKSLKWLVPAERISFDCNTVEVDLSAGQGDTAEYKFDEIELVQYTGRQDKNSKEIYEGDIIPYHFDKSVLGIVKYGQYINSFGEGKYAEHMGFYVDWTSEKYKRVLQKDLDYWIKVSEVIGNIYENPFERGEKIV